MNKIASDNNVIHLPRSRSQRPVVEPFGLYLRVGRNQHRELLDAMGGGERNYHGIVIDAGNTQRHAELKAHALQAGLDVALDPKTHAMSFPGSYSPSMEDLPWGLDRPHVATDFQGSDGRDISQQIAAFAAENQFTQVLGPTHIINGANDRWLRHDIANMGHLKDALDQSGEPIGLIYPLVVSMQTLRNALERDALVAAIADAPMDALWLRVENFDADATGEKTVAYIEAARSFHALGVPVIADHAGGLSGLGLLAFGAVGGLSHGLTLLEGFKASHWRRPKPEGRSNGSMPNRVYIPQLNILLKKPEAEAFLNSSTRTRGNYACRDTHCCPGGMTDMLNNPIRHFVHQRSGEIERLANTPESVRPMQYLDQSVRPISDRVAGAAGLGAITDELRKKLQKKQTRLGRFRQAIGHFAEANDVESVSQTPARREDRRS